MNEDVTRFAPLSTATLHILLSLAGEDRHGYGIMQEVTRQSDGQYKLGPGTLYDNLQKLIERKLIERKLIERKPVQPVGGRDEDDDPRRRYYRISPLGKAVLSAEVKRLEDVIRQAKLRLHPAKPRRA